MVRYWVLFLYSQGKDIHFHDFGNAAEGQTSAVRQAQEIDGIRCTGTTLRHGMGRELGGFKMQDTRTPVADPCRRTAKTTTTL